MLTLPVSRADESEAMQKRHWEPIVDHFGKIRKDCGRHDSPPGLYNRLSVRCQHRISNRNGGYG